MATFEIHYGDAMEMMRGMVEQGRKRLASVANVAPVVDFKAAQKRHEEKARKPVQKATQPQKEQLPLWAVG